MAPAEVTTVGITGVTGFLGWHVACRLKAHGIETVGATRTTFSDPDELAAFVNRVDVVMHIAGVNRAGTDDEIISGNIGLARALKEALDRSGRAVPVAYANSTHSSADNPYGHAKRAAGEILATHCVQTGAAFLDLVLPHLFGEFGRPNYNSAVTTFAHGLATGQEDVQVNRDGNLELLHAQDVAQRLVEFAAAPIAGTERLSGQTVTVGEVWDLLEQLHHRYVVEHTIPEFRDQFELHLFNTLRSQLYNNDYYPLPLTVHADHRGGFTELCRADGTGQTSISTSEAGISRGDHFHFDKIERFVVIGGDAQISLRRVLTNEIKRFDVSGTSPVVIDMPPLVTHNIVNQSSTIVTTLFWAGDHFDPDNPDTFIDPVEISQ